jgi:hypothetical protein
MELPKRQGSQAAQVALSANELVICRRRGHSIRIGKDWVEMYFLRLLDSGESRN